MTQFRTLRVSLAALALLCCGVLLAGCNWTGKGKDVASAIAAASTVKSGAYSGQMKMDVSAPAGSKSTGPQSVTMTFSGAYDGTDPAKPKMLMNMSADGQDTSMVMPGDGRMYLTAEGSSYSVPLDAAQAQQNSVDPAKVIAALGNAVGGFKEAPAMTNAKGQQVRTVTATVDRGQLCGQVLQAFGEATTAASGLGGGGGGGAQGSKMFQGLCKSMLKKDPRVWFGIDAGVLTDVAMTGQLTIPFAGTMSLEVQFHQFNLNQPQTGFDPPANAAPLNSLDELKSQGATGSAGGFAVPSSS